MTSVAGAFVVHFQSSSSLPVYCHTCPWTSLACAGHLRYSTHTWFENYVHLEILQIQALFGNGKILTATDIQKKNAASEIISFAFTHRLHVHYSLFSTALVNKGKLTQNHLIEWPEVGIHTYIR